ncbi:SpaA isopeptide-forming pilin-related protein [Clostridium hydrogeniformans]|uniref:SpaA isopeptide-forming pilin-related protein n=1 Tax=Clostridium hydrogeniformans TaxID=349933 RepID=UPI000489864C|nr:SpaA isopeptide-forming pilin-related protein [Clostridium hydrogeniformans]
MRKKRFSTISFLLALFMQFSMITPTVKAKAADLTDKIKFITGIKLTDGKGNPINESNPIKKNAEVILNYTFAVENVTTVKKGDKYVINIPKEIQIIKNSTFPLNLEDGSDSVGECTIDTNGKATIVFSDYLEKNSNVSGYFYVHTWFDESQIGNENPTPIVFDLGGNSEPVIINVNFEQPETPKASIYKEGAYNASKNEITWKVTVNPENVKVSNGKIVDMIQEGQEFIPGSVKINGKDASNESYNYDGQNKKLTYNFQDVINTMQTITFKTKIIDPKALGKEGTVTYQKNTATLSYDKVTKVSNEASVRVETDYINKSGSYDPLTKRINWIINVNNNAQRITNAVVTDNIPEGLKFTEGSVKLDGVESNSYKLEGPKLIYTFQNEINEPHKITFSTDVVDPDAYNSNASKEYKNIATLTGDGVPENTSDSKGVGVPTSLITKQGVNYNPSTGEITWKVTVNNNKIPIINGLVTDDIDLGQEYVDGSAEIKEGTEKGSFNYVKAELNDKQKTGTLTYNFNDTIKEIHTITFKTRVTDPKIYAGNSNKNYYNTVKLTGDNIKESKDRGTQNVQSYVMEKISNGFDYVSREFTWQIIVNRNKMHLKNAYVLDIINDGQEFVDNSVTINGKSADKKDYSYDNEKKTLRYNFLREINDYQVITFKTKLKDISDLSTNGEKQYKNTGTLIHDLVPGGVESTGTAKVKNTLVNKSAIYTMGNSYIDWNVTINSNKIPLKDASIIDVLQEGLELDTTSVQLFKQTLSSNGTLVKGEEVALNKNNVKYDANNREFTFILPSLTEEAYLLSFRTNVTDKSKSPFTNSVSFKGQGIKENSTVSNINVKFQETGGGGVGATGSIKVIKVDKENPSKKLKGAVFELLDKYDNVIKVSKPTGDNGEVLFDKLKFDIDYSIRESVAPIGYKLSDEVYPFQLKNSSDKKDIVYNYVNDKIIGEIEFYKNEEDNKPLKGAEFKIYKEEDSKFENPLSNAVSDEKGHVKFKNLEYGSYLIKEVLAPEGYLLSNEIIRAKVQEDGSIVKADPYVVSNKKIRGDIELIKVDPSKNLLQGAEFKLYRKSDSNFESPLATSISDTKGLVKFNNIEYGEYIIKETKAPKGYQRLYRNIPVNVTENNKTYNLGTIENLKIVEEVRLGDIKLKKVDENKNPLKGAEFTLYDSEGKKVKVSTSDDEGNVMFKDVPYGNYKIKETKAPEGYNIYTDDISVNINESGKVYDLGEIKNSKIKEEIKLGNIKLKKVDENKNPLKGAEFTLYDSEGKKVKVSTSNDDGIVMFKDVPYGNYKIKETKAPEGYEALKNDIEVFVSKAGYVYEYEVINNKSKVIETTGNIEIKKVDGNGNILQGAEFTLYDKDGNIVFVSISDKNGIAVFNDIKYGKYTIKETKAPEGYILSDKEISIDVNSSETQKFIMENTKEIKKEDPNKVEPDKPGSKKTNGIMPQTGSIINTTILILLGSMLILLGLGFVIRVRKVGE